MFAVTEALPGGPAAKVALRYEHYWTVFRISQMLDGEVNRIRLEPPGTAGVGVELVLDMGGVTWGEQTKNALRNWTIKRLRDEGVLVAAKNHIDQGRRFRFVTSSSASDFSVLTGRARQAETFTEYSQSIGTTRLVALEAISSDWAVTREETWRLLKYVEVEHLPFASLRRFVRGAIRHLYVDDPDLIIGELRNFCDRHLAQTFTGPQVWTHLESKGFTRRLIRGDQSVLRQLYRTVERQGRRIECSKPRIGFIRRPDVETILEKLRSSASPQVFVLDGRAGSGKSTVATHIATCLRDEGWFVTVARMDTNASMPTSDHLGREMGLTETPSVLLAGVSDGLSALLVVDQLDAVSTFSGRMPDNFESVADVLEEVKASPNIRVLLVVRSVDLEEDPRLISLVSNHRVEQHTLGLLDVGDVRQQLATNNMGIPTSDFTLELLRIPLHLTVFSRLSSSAQSHPFRTLQELYERYTEETRVRVERRLGRLDWARVTGLLVDHMNSNQVLAAPVAVLDGESVQEARALESESVLVRDDTRIAFFHESFFDYTFARAFVAAGHSLRMFLIESGQHLFRRSQTRQVLEHLAATDRSRFRAAVVDLLTSDDIRSHLKVVVTRVLRQIEPTSEDWLVMEDIAWSDPRLGNKLLSLLNLPGWFDVVDDLHLWESWLADPNRVDLVFADLIAVAKKRPLRVAELLRPYVSRSEKWRNRIRALIEWSLNKDLVPLAVELVERGQLDDARGPIAINSDFWSLFHSFQDEDPEGAAHLMGAYLRQALQRAQQCGSADPFQSGHLSRDSQSHSVIGDVSAEAPARFIHEVLPFVINVAMANQYQNEGALPRGRCWGVAGPLSDHTVDGAIFLATDAALREFAQSNPVECEDDLDKLRFADSLELRYLACRALASKTDPDDGIGWITADPRHFRLGLLDSPQWASYELIKVHSPNCSSELFEKLESKILDYSPAWETPEGRGYGKYVLLTALDSTRMSDTAKQAFEALEQRFPSSPPEPPRANRAFIVESPINEDTSPTLSDDDWIRELREHDHDEVDWSGSVPVGGARELAGVLGQRAKEDPDRFAKLGFRFTDATPAIAMEEILRNVEGSVDVDTLAELCQHAHATYGLAVGRSVCSAIARAEGTHPTLVELVAIYSQAPEEDHGLVLVDGVPWSEGDLLNPGINTTPGQAAWAAASILFSGEEYVETLLPVVTELALHSSFPVRSCAARAVIALLRHSSSDALDIAARLFEPSVEVLNARTSERLLTYTIVRDPERFAPVLEEALGARAQIAQRAGRVWAITGLNATLPAGVSNKFQALPTAARRGAAKVFAHNASSSLDTLRLAFNDDDPEVRQQAGRSISSLVELVPAELESFLRNLLDSRALPEHVDILAFNLKELTSRLPASTIDICERAVLIAGSDLGDIRTRHSALGSFLITILLRLYKQGDASLRSRCLDVIDQLTDLNAYGVEEALKSER